MSRRRKIISSIIIVMVIIGNISFAFASEKAVGVDNETIVVLDKEILEDNKTIQYGFNVTDDGGIEVKPFGIFDFGMESYDGILDLQSWNGTSILFSIRLSSSEINMLSHSGTIEIHKVSSLGLIGDKYNSQTFLIESPFAVNHLSQTYNMYVGNESKIYIKLTNLRVNRIAEGLLSIPNAQKRFDKKDF